MTLNPALMIDGYKLDHRRQYPNGITKVFSNLTARKTRRQNTDKVVFFGLQYFIKKYLIQHWNEDFFKKSKQEVCDRFSKIINSYLGPNGVGVKHIEALHDLGYLPLEIYALPEGTAHKLGVPSVVIWNTKDEFAWLTNYIETVFSTIIWGPCTSATTAHQYKKLLNKYAMATVGDTSFVQWQGHDFSFRGMFGLEAALMSGAAHLISFTGSDTIPAIEFLQEYYNADIESSLVAGSVPATEHSVACSTILNFVEKIRIEKLGNSETIIEDELMDLADIEYVRHLIQDIYPTGIVSIVSDSFDYWNTITQTAKALKDIILNRDGKVVFRPDTGNPVRVICGYTVAPTIDELHCNVNNTIFSPEEKAQQIQAAINNGYSAFKDSDESVREILPNGTLGKTLTDFEIKGSVKCLWEIFNGVTTDFGYQLLDSHVGLIYGDSITLEIAEQICKELKNNWFASTNIVFGIGSFTYQYVTRDTDGYAVKATYCEIDGKPLEIYKKPKTGDGTKNSAKGLLAVFKNQDGEFVLEENSTWDRVRNCEFIPVFRDSELLKDWTLSEIRANIAQYE